MCLRKSKRMGGISVETLALYKANSLYVFVKPGLFDCPMAGKYQRKQHEDTAQEYLDISLSALPHRTPLAPLGACGKGQGRH